MESSNLRTKFYLTNKIYYSNRPALIDFENLNNNNRKKQKQ